MTTPSGPRRRTFGRAMTACVASVIMLLAPASFAQAQQDDSNLEQDIAEDQEVVRGEQKVLTAGHVDLGPRYVDGEWTFLVHDDAAKADANATSVWRFPDEVVLHVLDDAQLTVPADPAYDFLGIDDGSTVWVVPQTQNPDVVWVGWNTQDPDVMSTIDRGITLSLTGVSGPGSMTTYLQSGSFGEPELLFDSRNAEAQPVWVDVNTHTHANWVFSAPGVYLVQVTAEADLVDGSHVSDTQVIRFAVGSSTSPADAFAATWDGEVPQADGDGDEAAAETEASESSESESDPLVPWLIGAIITVSVVFVVGFSIAIVRTNRSRKKALRSPAESGSSAAEEPGA